MKRLFCALFLSAFCFTLLAPPASARPYHVKPRKPKRHRAVRH